MSVTDPVSQYMSPRPLVLKPSDSAESARELFVEQRFTVVPVVGDDGGLVGVLSATDILSQGAHPELSTRAVASLMTARVLTETSTTRLADAAVLMAANGVHHLVIVDGMSRPTGVLSSLDVAAAIADSDLDEPIEGLMSTVLVDIDAGTPVDEALDAFEESEVSAALVRDQGELVGVLSQLALLRADAERRVDQVMDPDIRTVSRHTTVTEVGELFADNSLRHLLVSGEDGAIQGLVTPTDLVRYLAGVAEYDGPGGD